jgi:two-component system OmpR family sensor kinase
VTAATPAALGRGLGRSLALATILGMLIFGVAMGLMIYFTEVGETCDVAGEIEDPPLEIIKQTSLAFAFAVPLGLTLAVVIARSLTHRTTERLDVVISSASSMTGERLDDRLPVSTSHDALDKLSDAINGVLARIERGVQAQAQFAADASHELRTPLTVITTNLEVARRKARDPSHWEHVADDALGEVKRMAVIVEKLLELSRAGAAGLTHTPIDLRKLATAALGRVSPLAVERGVTVVLAPGAPLTVEVDVDALGIVLDNLLRNALDHSPTDSTVTITVQGRTEQPRIVVADQGPGVVPELRERIFEPFARASTAIDRAPGPGLGLGLAICRRIVTGHRGTILCSDAPGGGAAFTIELPPA